MEIITLRMILIPFKHATRGFKLEFSYLKIYLNCFTLMFKYIAPKLSYV